VRADFAGACRGPDRARHGEPEELYIVLARPYGHEGDTAILTRMVRPRAQQRRLPGAGRRRENRDPLLGCPVQGGHQVVTVDQLRLLPRSLALKHSCGASQVWPILCPPSSSQLRLDLGSFGPPPLLQRLR
jgi:hypothetical protein